MRDLNFTKIDVRGLSEEKINKIKEKLSSYGYKDECNIKTKNVTSLHVVITVFSDNYKEDDIQEDSIFNLISYKEIIEDNKLINLI